MTIYSKLTSLHHPKRFDFPDNLLTTEFLTTSSYPYRNGLRFVWPRRTIFRNLLCFIRKTCRRVLNLFLVIALKSGTELHFWYSSLFEIRSVRWALKTILRQFPWKIYRKSSPVFERTHISEPCSTSIITDYHLRYSNFRSKTYLPILTKNFFRKTGTLLWQKKKWTTSII